MSAALKPTPSMTDAEWEARAEEFNEKRARLAQAEKRLEQADAVLAASIFHFGTYDIASIKAYLAGRGIAVRPTRAAAQSDDATKPGAAR